MVLVEDDNLVSPSIPEPQLQYIIHLPDTYQTYTRFFDGLLIPRPSHSSFFQDLRSFRTQPTVIALFMACTPSPEVLKEVTRARYRDVTRTYLASRFAHPWCRNAMAGSAGSKGWWGAEWAATGRKMSQEAKNQEEKLHKLLVPIWIVMRGRMFPGREIIEPWYEVKLAKDEEQRRARERIQIANVRDQSGKDYTETEMKGIVKDQDSQHTTSRTIEPAPVSRKIETSKSCTNMRQDFWDSDEAAEMEDELRIRDQQAANAATSVFRLAAAGVLVESMSRREKWKLKRLLKK